MDARYKHILGLDEPPCTTVFLPWIGEFGWYLMNHVKRVHAYNATKKIAFIKPGHECLFPTVQEFIYNWEDVHDDQKAGIITNTQRIDLVDRILARYGSDIKIISHEETSWDEKTSLASHTFVPSNQLKHDLKVDVVISPRKRNMDSFRNLNCWQQIVDQFLERGLTVGVAGNKVATAQLNGITHYASDYVDVDSDVELIKSAKFCVAQESGMAYLMMMCRKPLFMIDHEPVVPVRDMHRDPTVFFEVVDITKEYDWRVAIDKISLA